MSGDAAIDEPTRLMALLRSRHWQKHSTFTREWDKAAATIDRKLIGTAPRHAQFYRWLRGDLRDLPYPDACRVLQAMFPQYSIKELFQPCSDAPIEPMPSLADSNDLASAVLPSSEPTAFGISSAWPRTDAAVLEDLITRVESARREISVFGLTRNFYAKDEMLPLFEERAHHIPVTFFVMDPRCDSRRDRYRLEPVEAAMENPARYIREVLRPPV